MSGGERSRSNRGKGSPTLAALQDLARPAEPEAQAEVDGTDDATDPCYYPDCPERARNRGLCKRHYVSAVRMLKSSQADEADLLKRGLLGLRRGHGGRSLGETQFDAFLRGSSVVGRGPSLNDPHESPDEVEDEVTSPLTIDRAASSPQTSAFEEAAQRFDREQRSKLEWREWELATERTAAVLLKGRLYPPEVLVGHDVPDLVAQDGALATLEEATCRVVLLDRYVEARARRFVETVMPDASVRESYLSFLAESVEVIAQHTGFWWVTLKTERRTATPGRIWLNVGTYYRQAIEWPLVWLTFDDEAYVSLDRPKIVDLGCELGRPVVEKSTGDTVYQIAVPAEQWAAVLPLLRAAHFQTLERVGVRAKRTHPSASQGSSPALLDHLASRSGRPRAARTTAS